MWEKREKKDGRTNGKRFGREKRTCGKGAKGGKQWSVVGLPELHARLAPRLAQGVGQGGQFQDK